MAAFRHALAAATLGLALCGSAGAETAMLASLLVDELSEKSFEFLAAAVPKLRRAAVLMDRNAVNFGLQTKAVQRAAARHALDVRFAEVGKTEEIEAALAKAANEGAEALVVTASPMLV